MGLRANFEFDPVNIPQQDLNIDYQEFKSFTGGAGTNFNFDTKTGKRFYISSIAFISNGTTDVYTLSDSTKDIIKITSPVTNNEEKVIFFEDGLIFQDEININVTLVTGGGAPTQSFTFKGTLDA